MQTILVKKFTIDGIPLSIYERNTDENKPVIFSFHGFDGYKDGDFFKREDALARLGFIVVGMDSILHGERRIEPFEAMPYSEKMKDIHEVIIQSAMDAKRLYEKYIQYFDRVIPNEVYAMGVSMGGAISIYLSTIFDLKKAVSIVGSPSMVDFYKYKKKQYGWENDFYYQRNLTYLQAHDPVIHKDKIRCPLFLTGGRQDDVIPVEMVLKLNSPLVTIKLYDTPHMPNQQQFDDAYAFLLQKDV